MYVCVGGVRLAYLVYKLQFTIQYAWTLTAKGHRAIVTSLCFKMFSALYISKLYIKDSCVCHVLLECSDVCILHVVISFAS